jgi:hypothetical protein
VVPDTSALLQNPEIQSYSSITGSPRTTVVHVLPVVLRELDDLKDRGRTPELRGKAQAVMRRFKGLRDKGSLADGVAVTRNVTVLAEHRDVEPHSILEWLRAEVNDDWLISGALDIQKRHPEDVVVLVTPDLGLQTKADVARLPYAETPRDSRDRLASLKPSLGSRHSRESLTRVLVLTVENNGPATARDVEVSVATVGSRPTITEGPWTLLELDKNKSFSHDLVMIRSGDVVVSCRWTDANGRREQSWQL